MPGLAAMNMMATANSTTAKPMTDILGPSSSTIMPIGNAATGMNP